MIMRVLFVRMFYVVADFILSGSCIYYMYLLYLSYVFIIS